MTYRLKQSDVNEKKEKIVSFILLLKFIRVSLMLRIFC